MAAQVFQRNIFQANVFQIGIIEEITLEVTSNQGKAVVSAELGKALLSEATATAIDRAAK